MSRLNCPACDFMNGKDVYVVNDYTVKRCNICASLFITNVPNKDILMNIYTNMEYYDLDNQAIDRIKNDHRRRIKKLKSLSTSRKVLDVGCTTGLFLDEAALAGYETFGIELSEKNVKIAEKKGHDVFLGDLENYIKNSLNEKFSVITCFDVVEHIENPYGFMKLLSKCLTSDGIIVLSTPNYSGVVSKVLGKRDVFLTPPEHLNFFTLKGFLTLADKVDLYPEHTCTFGVLTKNELHRSIIKYFPKFLHPLAPLLQIAIQISLHTLNRINFGLEMEIYFSKQKR